MYEGVHEAADMRLHVKTIHVGVLIYIDRFWLSEIFNNYIKY